MYFCYVRVPWKIWEASKLLPTYLPTFKMLQGTITPRTAIMRQKRAWCKKHFFRRRNLSYHCVRRCYSRLYYWRIGTSRRGFLNCRDAARREIRRARRLRCRYKVILLKDLSLYESCTTGTPHVFNFECHDIKMIEIIIYRLGPGRIIDDLAIFDLDTSNSED